MRKLLISIVAIIVLAILGAVYLLPSYINSQITAKFQQKIKAEQVTAELTTSPDYMLLFGDVDSLNLTAQNVNLDKVMLNTLTVTGNNLQFSVEDLLLARRLVLNSADSFNIVGTIDEANLAKLLNEKVSNISDIVVTIAPDKIQALGKISLFGNRIDVIVNGKFVLEQNNLIFRITDVSTSNNFLGNLNLNFTKDILIGNEQALPIEGARFTNVEQQNGQILIEASVKPGINR